MRNHRIGSRGEGANAEGGVNGVGCYLRARSAHQTHPVLRVSIRHQPSVVAAGAFFACGESKRNWQVEGGKKD